MAPRPSVQKTCSRCREAKSLDEFNVDNSRPDRRCSRCKTCARTTASDHYADNRDVVSERGKAARRAPGQDGAKKCTRCGVSKHYSEFRKGGGVGGTASECIACNKAQRRLRDHGVSEEEFVKKLDEQGGVCAICQCLEGPSRGRRFVLDHCHETGAFRGVLCRQCNSALGALGDTRTAIQRVVDYLA
jgi:hypothetical protein